MDTQRGNAQPAIISHVTNAAEIADRVIRGAVLYFEFCKTRALLMASEAEGQGEGGPPWGANR